jgi:hypothetical protein
MHDCTRATCFVPDTGCDLGHLNPSECPAWNGRPEAGTGEPNLGEDALLPWSGSALGSADLPFVAGRSRPFVIGIIGPQNAGKTTLLGAWYLLIGRGLCSNERRRFAGSYSLAGWEAVAESLRWSPGQPPTFPPHTTSRGGRAPGLLHLAFREYERSLLKNFLFTDAPGEWFHKWAVNRDSPDAVGARWVANRADLLLLVADRDALAGQNKGTARNAIQLLAQRVAAERRGRPVGLVWTKADVVISETMHMAVRRAVLDPMPDAVEFSVSIVSSGEDTSDRGTGLLELLEWTLSVRRDLGALPAPSLETTDALFLYGSRS